jgi:hypothetical protein
MEIIIHSPAQWNSKSGTNNVNIWNKWLSVLDSQNKNKTLWYVFSLVAQGILFLPVPAALIYYFNAPIFTLAITLSLYFANIIAGMGGAGIRTMISFFLISILIHLAMVAIYTL